MAKGQVEGGKALQAARAAEIDAATCKEARDLYKPCPGTPWRMLLLFLHFSARLIRSVPGTALQVLYKKECAFSMWLVRAIGIW